MNKSILQKLQLSMLAAALAAASVGYAATTFWPNEGNTATNQGPYGFVGKGDVQIPWGWNNNKLQNQAEYVTFSYQQVGAYTVVCDGHTNASQNPKTYTNKELSIVSEVGYENRTNKKGQINGFKLMDLGEEVSDGEGCPPAWPITVSKTPNENAGEVVGIVAQHPDEVDLVLDTIFMP
jgi:hypothetical protein